MTKDLLAIEGMEFYARHGLFDFERQIGTTFMVDAYIHLDLSAAGESDELEDTLDYTIVYDKVDKIMNEPQNLIEYLGYQIAESIFNDFSSINYLKIRVSKMSPPISGKVQRTFVEFERSRN